MEIIIIYYIFFPLLHKCIKKFPVFSLLVATLPCVLVEIKGNISILISTDRELFYILPFLIGILLADKKILDKLVIYCNKNRMEVLIISIFSVLVSQYLSTQFRLIPNVFYAMAIIFLGISLKSIGLTITKYLEILGKNSMNIFLVHSFYYYYFIIFYKFMNVQKFFIFKYLELLLISLGTSMLIEKFKVDLFIKRKIEDRKIETEEETKEELEEVYAKK